MFSKSATFYDAIYAAVGKNYVREAEILHTIIRQRKRSLGNALLDIACGTGAHVQALAQYYDVTGLDLDPNILDVARQRCPNVAFYQADMADFFLEHKFDVVACLFSSIGYVKTVERLRQAIATMKKHLHPGGVSIVEPWFPPGVLQSGNVYAAFVDQPQLKIARMNVHEIVENVSILNFHYLVATRQGVDHFTERHELGLFTHEEYQSAFQSAGFETIHDSEGLDGRGLYIGLNPL